jgi:cytochrome c oxidase cbb3-type subunit 4
MMGWSIVNNLKDYFHTDWSAMTQHDWVGLIMTIVVFFVMVGLYLYVFHPANKERFESQRYIPLDDDDDMFSKQASHHRFNQRPEHSPKHAGTEEQK